MPRGGLEHCINGHVFDVDNTYIKPNGCRTCRQCAADRAREYRKGRAARRNWSETAKQKAAESHKRWAEKHPEKTEAHKALGYAVRKGRVSKGPCEVCGESLVHGHHDDYSKPLEVRWLCPKHHSKVTRGREAMA